VTVTDVPGASDSNVLSKLLGRPLASSPSGASVALQADQSPWVNNDVFDTQLFSSEQGKALRLFSKAENAGPDAGMIGYWDVRNNDGKVNDFLTSQDLLQIVGSAEVDRTFVLRSYYTERVYTVTVLAHADSGEIKMPMIPVVLDAFQFDIISVSLVRNGVAVLGLIDKYNSLAGVDSLKWEPERFIANLKCCGKLGIFVEDKVEKRLKFSFASDSGGMELHPAKSVEAMGSLQGSVITTDLVETHPSLSVVIEL